MDKIKVHRSHISAREVRTRGWTRPLRLHLKRCPQCGKKSPFIYRCDDGQDKCVVCLIKETGRKYGQR
jgi:hypothetical protein